jgi:hypothetical protein
MMGATQGLCIIESLELIARMESNASRSPLTKFSLFVVLP